MTVITDAQLHVWRPDTPQHPWPDGTHAFAHGPAMSPEHLLGVMDRVGVDRAVLVPPSWAGDSNEYCAEAAARHSGRFAVAGRVPLHTPLSVDELANMRDRWSLKALRFTFARGAAAGWMTDGTADWLWGTAQEIDIPVFVYAPGLADQIDAVATAYPRLRLTLDHLMLATEWRDGEITEPIRRTIALARHPNVSVKASALHSFVTDDYPFRSLHAHVRDVIGAFGAERVFWGSDATRDLDRYPDAVRLFTEALDFLDARDRDLILGGALNRHLDWP